MNPVFDGIDGAKKAPAGLLNESGDWPHYGISSGTLDAKAGGDGSTI